MNVLIIGTTDILGGAAKVSWDIKTALEAQGHTVSVFVADKRSNDKGVRTIPRHYWRKVLGFVLATERFIDTDWLLATPEFKAADIIHCHNLHGRYFNLHTLEKMAAVKPVVWTLHDEWAITPHCAYTLEGTELKNGLYVCPSIDTPPRLLWDNTTALACERNELYKNIQRLTVVAPSKWLHGRVQQTTLSKHHTLLIPNGIDTSIFTRTEKQAARQALNLPKDKTIILFLATAGKANTWKGWVYTEAVIAAYQNDPSVLFLNVGNLSPETSTSNIEYRPHEDDPHTLALYYSAADLLLFTSIADNFPLVILEAMSCGLPIVGFRVGGVPEVLTHLENGYLARYRNTEDLVAGVAWMQALSPNEREELSARSSAKIQTTYTTKQMTDRYLTLYQTLLTTTP